MKATTTQNENHHDTYEGADPGSPGKSGKQAEGQYDDQIRGQHSRGHGTRTDELGEGDGQQHREEDAQKVGVGQSNVRSDDVEVICGMEVAAAKNAKGRLKDGHGGNHVATDQ